MQVSKNSLISSFSSGRFPTGGDFENLIDSCYNDGSVVSSLSAVSAFNGNTYSNYISAQTSQVTSLTATTLYTPSLNFDSISTDGSVGIDASMVVSLMPSGSGILYFEKGILVGYTVL